MSISQGVLDILANAPQPGDNKEEFNNKAWPFAAIMYQLGVEINSTVANLNLEATNSTSTTSFAIGSVGTDRNFTVQPNKSYVIGMTVRAAVTADGSKYIQGEVKSYNISTGAIVVAVTQISSTGTFAAWTVSQAITLEPIGLGAAVASAATPNIWARDGKSRNYTGVVDTTGFASAPYAGAFMYLRIVNGVKFIGDPNLIVPGGTITTEATDLVMVFAISTTQFQIFVFKSNGMAAVPTPITSASIPDNAIQMRHLSTAVSRKVKGFGVRGKGDFAYECMQILLDDNTMVGWGRGSTGVLSAGNASNESWTPTKPAFIPALPDNVTVIDFSVNQTSIFAVCSNGWVYSCGSNDYGQLGLGDTATRDTFTRIEYFFTNSISIVKAISDSSRLSPGISGSYFLNASGEVWSCGYNGNGQLGLGDTSNRSTPVKVSSLINITKLVVAGASSASMVMALKNDGTVYACGYNTSGQLGVGDTTSRSSFTQCLGLSGVVITDIDCATGTDNTSPSNYGGFAMVLSSLKEVYTTGGNNAGQLGLGDTTNRNQFNKVTGLSNISQIGCGGGYYGYSFAVSDAGRLYTWGWNSSGCLGDGTGTNRTSPYNVAMYNTVSKNAVTAVLTDPPFIGKIKQVKPHKGSQGGHSSLIVLDTDGKMWISGNDYGSVCGAGYTNKTRFTPFLPVKYSVAGEKLIDFDIWGYDNYQSFFAVSDQKYLYGSGYNGYGLINNRGSVPTTIPSMQRVEL